MELIQRGLPIVALFTSLGLIVKKYIYDFMSVGIVKQVLETFTGLTPREAGDILIIQAKHLILLVKTSMALVLNTFFLVYDKIVAILPGVGSGNTTDFMINVLNFYGNILYNSIMAILKLFRFLFHFIVQFFQLMYTIGQGIYACMAMLNKGLRAIISVWNWFQEPPVSDRFMIIMGIFILSLAIYFGRKFYRTCFKKKSSKVE